MTPLLDNFFNPQILAQYWPSILGGFWLTVEVALLTIARRRADRPGAGDRAGDALAAGRHRHHRLRRHLPHAAAARRHRVPLFRPALCRHPALALRRDGAGAGRGAGGLRRPRSSGPPSRPCRRASGTPRARSGCGFLRILFLVILPQAIRIAVPLLTNRAIAITKGTALGTAVVAARAAGPRAERHGDRRQPLAAHPGGGALPAVLRAPGRRQPLARRPARAEGGTDMEALQLFLDNFADWDSLRPHLAAAVAGPAAHRPARGRHRCRSPSRSAC